MVGEKRRSRGGHVVRVRRKVAENHAARARFAVGPDVERVHFKHACAETVVGVYVIDAPRGNLRICNHRENGGAGHLMVLPTVVENRSLAATEDQIGSAHRRAGVWIEFEVDFEYVLLAGTGEIHVGQTIFELFFRARGPVPHPTREFGQTDRRIHLNRKALFRIVASDTVEDASVEENASRGNHDAIVVEQVFADLERNQVPAAAARAA